MTILDRLKKDRVCEVFIRGDGMVVIEEKNGEVFDTTLTVEETRKLGQELIDFANSVEELL